MYTYNKNNKFVSYLVFLLALFILVLFTNDIFSKIQENKDTRGQTKLELETKKNTLKQLNDLKVKMNNSNIDIEKYNVVISDSEIMNYIYSNIEKMSSTDWIIMINNILIWDTKETEIWFKETVININLKVPNEKKLKQVFDFLTSKDSKYNFILWSLSFPYWNLNTDFNINIPLRILHK